MTKQAKPDCEMPELSHKVVPQPQNVEFQIALHDLGR